jgi:hypothetical protein
VRREVLKRVSQFEDFSSCWENDRYKTQGHVAQIQKVVNVKDSFTRINLDREKERKERQDACNASVQAKQRGRRTAPLSGTRSIDCSPKPMSASGESSLRPS